MPQCVRTALLWVVRGGHEGSSDSSRTTSSAVWRLTSRESSSRFVCDGVVDNCYKTHSSPTGEAVMITTALTRRFALQYPLVLAPMGGVAGGELAAAVSNAGGLGLVGGGYGDTAWLRRELDLVRQLTEKPWGVGLITWAISPGVLQLTLDYRPHAVMLSFGDPRPHAKSIKDRGAVLICQVQDIESAHLAMQAGADFIVAQGTEAGGHGSARATLPLVPAVVDAVAPLPVLAAGGISDGRGVAAALMLGTEGALIGTRFYASHQALGAAAAKREITTRRGGDTLRTQVFDIVRGYDWPAPYTGRAVRNDFIARWHGNEAALAASLDVERPAYFSAAQAEDVATAVVWAGEGIDMIDAVEDAARLVVRIGAQTEAQLNRGVNLLR